MYACRDNGDCRNALRRCGPDLQPAQEAPDSPPPDLDRQTKEGKMEKAPQEAANQ